MAGFMQPDDPTMYDETCDIHGLWWSLNGDCPECVEDAERAAVEALGEPR